LLNQTDKLLLSKFLTLEAFGYYALAGAVASALHYLGNPIFTAFFPALTQRFGTGDSVGLTEQYHKATQILVVALMPVVGIMVGFPQELIFAWTGDLETVKNSYQVLRLLSLSTALNVLASIPYCLQLAHGWTRLGLLMNTVAVVIVAPAMLVAVSLFGALGAATVSLVVSSVFSFSYS
jgi:O-antigen/teichoic acid export membrane protein